MSDVAPHIPWKRERRQYVARAFGSQKCSVLVADRVRRPDGQQRAQAAAEGIIKSGGCAFAMRVDVSDQTQGGEKVPD